MNEIIKQLKLNIPDHNFIDLSTYCTDIKKYMHITNNQSQFKDNKTVVCIYRSKDNEELFNIMSLYGLSSINCKMIFCYSVNYAHCVEGSNYIKCVRGLLEMSDLPYEECLICCDNTPLQICCTQCAKSVCRSCYNKIKHSYIYTCPHCRFEMFSEFEYELIN